VVSVGQSLPIVAEDTEKGTFRREGICLEWGIPCVVYQERADDVIIPDGVVYVLRENVARVYRYPSPKKWLFTVEWGLAHGEERIEFCTAGWSRP
jgi:hypothetical protein